MKEFWDYVVKNKYVISCVLIVIILYALGVVEFLTKAVVLLALLAGAIFLGKKIQDNEEAFINFFKGRGFREQEVYYYKEEKDSKKK